MGYFIIVLHRSLGYKASYAGIHAVYADVGNVHYFHLNQIQK